MLQVGAVEQMRQLQVGDRVRVYGYGPDMSMKPICGEIHRDTMGEFIKVKTDRKSWAQESVEYLWAHPKQCRRLKPRAKPERKELRRVWIRRDHLNKILAIKNNTDCFPAKASPVQRPSQHGYDLEFTETPPGSVVVDREGLERAAETYREQVHGSEYGGSLPDFIQFLAKAIGLPEKEGT